MFGIGKTVHKIKNLIYNNNVDSIQWCCAEGVYTYLHYEYSLCLLEDKKENWVCARMYVSSQKLG